MYDSLLAASASSKLVQAISREIANPIIVVMFAFALVAFLWGVREYIHGADNPEARVKGAQHIMWGVIGMALMLMSFTIVRIVLKTFGLYDSSEKEVENVLGNTGKGTSH